MKQCLIQTLEKLIPEKKFPIKSKGKLLMTTFSYYTLAVIILIAYFGLHFNLFILIIFVYSLVPLLDELIDIDQTNPTTSERLELQRNDFWFKSVIYFTAACDWLLFFKMMEFFVNCQFTPFSILNLMIILFIFGGLQSTQFTISHQMFHKQNFFDRFLGTIHMSKLLYMHFTYEHIWGHHRKVATPQDPASAQKGVNIYTFVKRSFLGSYKSVYQMQVDACKPIYLNCAFLSILSAVGFCTLIWKAYGTQGFICYLISAFIAIFFLEGMNYIEHYGLRRQKEKNGQYQKVSIKHSWNSPHMLSNYLLFKLQRHSDHHQNCLKPYQTLLSFKDSPELLHGYSLTLIMSFYPSVWFKIMDPLVDQYNQQRKENIDSKVRAQSKKFIRYFIIENLVTSFVVCILNYAILWFGHSYELDRLSA